MVAEITAPDPSFQRDAFEKFLASAPFSIPVREGPNVKTVTGAFKMLMARYGCEMGFNRAEGKIWVNPKANGYFGRNELLEELYSVISNSTSMNIVQKTRFFIDCRAMENDRVVYESSRNGFLRAKIIPGLVSKEFGRYPSEILNELLMINFSDYLGMRVKMQLRVGTVLLKEEPQLRMCDNVRQLSDYLLKGFTHRNFIPGVTIPSCEFPILGRAEIERVFAVTLKEGQMQIRLTLVDLRRASVKNNYLVADLGNGLALKSCYEADRRLFSLECLNITGYDVRVQMQFDVLRRVDQFIAWAKECYMNSSDDLVVPSRSQHVLRWDQTRTKVRYRYIVGDVVFDVAAVQTSTCEGPKEDATEVEVSSRVFNDWASGIRAKELRALPNIDWDKLFDFAWHVGERIEEQRIHLKRERERWWHCGAGEGVEQSCFEKPNDDDMRRLVRFYHESPVEGKVLGRIRVICNKEKEGMFRTRMGELQQRFGNKPFDPRWPGDDRTGWRQDIFRRCVEKTSEFTDKDFPNVKLMPVWHGTNANAAESIMKGGFAALASTDSGWFGKGLYFAAEAKYSYKHYGQALLFNWLCFFSPYPTIHGDRAKLEGKGAFENYDAHFVPIGKDFQPTASGQDAMYTEVVVFDNSQCLPRYLVELKDVDTPQKAIAPGNIFLSSTSFSLVAASQYCYATFLSKPLHPGDAEVRLGIPFCV